LSAAAWSEWLDKELSKSEEIYNLDPDRLISSYNRERSHIKDYHGRELLELIQNADDAGSDFPGDSRLLIKLQNNVLLVANTGLPFSPKGIKSLMVSDISPKQEAGEKFIGYKGLGFRSLLGWAKSITILSGHARIGVSETRARAWLSKLMGKHTNIRNQVEDYTRNKQNFAPIATLDAPQWLSGAEEEFASLELISQNFIESGYDTVICIGFNDIDIQKQIEAQIREIQGEIFVFLRHLQEVIIEADEYKYSWNIERDKDVVEIVEEGGKTQIWDIFSKRGEIPNELLDQDKTENKYEITVAIPAEESETPGRVFVYFPTKEEFPFRLIAHATFELSANRQRINNSPVNAYISDRLAELMAETSEKITRLSDPWFAISKFVPRNYHLSIALLEFGFFKNFKDKLKRQKIVPNLNSEFMAANEIYSMPSDFQSLRHMIEFKDIAQFSKDQSIFSYLDIETLPHDEFVERVNNLTGKVSIQLRALLIFKYVNVYGRTNSEKRPNLLIDLKGSTIPGSARTSLPPERQSFELPKWVPIRIINNVLVDELRVLFSVETVRDVRHKLNLFNVQEYNLTTVVSSMIAASNARVKDYPLIEKQYRQELVQALWTLYSSMDNPGNFQERITVPLLTNTGKVKPAESLYFSKEYACGLISGYLYKNISADVLLANPIDYGFEDTSDELESFFKWLGVADSPRLVELPEVSSRGFIENVIVTLSEPVDFGDFAKTREELLSAPSWCFKAKEIKSFDHLEEILASADQHAILAWIADCRDLEDLRRNGDIQARFLYTPTELRRPRKADETIPSYPVWLINNTKWIQAQSSEKIMMAPVAMSTAKAAQDLSPIIGYPAIDLKHEIFEKMGLDKTAITLALRKSGVIQDFDDFPWSTFYHILFHLPEIDPDCRRSRSIYRAMIARSVEEESLPTSHESKDFIEKGEIAGLKDQVLGYYPVNELFYVENNTIPDHIANHYPIALIDRRRGAKKIKAIFGIDALNTEVINTNILKIVEHPGNEIFNSDLERLKPYIYAFRIDADANQNELRAIKKFSLKLCSSLECSIEVNTQTIQIDILPGKSIQQDGIAYLVTDKVTDNLLMDELIAGAVGEVLTNLLKVDISADIARILSCSDDNKIDLLSSILGGDGLEYLERSMVNFETIDTPEAEFSWPAILPSEPNQGENTEGAESEVGYETEEEELTDNPIGELSITQKDHRPSRSVKRTLVVSKNPGKATNQHRGKRVNADRAEELAMRFEEDQARFPLLVSQLRGTIAPGCDLLSFSTMEDLKKFKEEAVTKVDFSTVIRFIEVKSRNSAAGAIVLAGNELNRAVESKDNYFLYRIYESQKGRFELVELSDPLHDNDSLKIQYEINPFQAKNTLRWDVFEEIDYD